ncbi:hypothetical protein PCH_Pc22g03770 [Penicillium rubens Wisconsin 54-1255]|uniref:Uncharacterized protein n=1 Tax=Penicillium rubens (strain ATCC 28089 / DSM 1075 / NRRL 1951 / Wisconsin 54-1255) TaxID=500485 RepID=B6HS64_PENRW|nr:hypothetical protein PCH_Pc22g03770 [Penicillium rubens Wisconsin 54-1255]
MPPKRGEAANGPQTPAKTAECTDNTPNTPAASHGVHAKLLEYTDPAETGRTSGSTLKITCIRDADSSVVKRCCHAHDKCKLGPRFELHALLEWVMEFWINEESEFGQTDDASLVHDIEKVHAAAVAVRDLSAGVDRLIKFHGSAHNLVGELGGSAFRLRLVPVAMVLRTPSASNSSIVLANTVVLISILTLVCLGI